MTPTAATIDDAALATRQGTLCFAAAEALKETFAKRFDFWFQHDGWQLMPSPWHDHPSQNLQALGDLDVYREVCDCAFARLQPDVRNNANGQAVLGIPVIQQGRVAAVATRAFATDSPELLLQLGSVFIQRWLDKEESRRLREENHALAEQVSQDFEELMFLRAISAEIRVSDTPSGLEAIAERMLSLLNDSIHARTLVLVEAVPGTSKFDRVSAWAGPHPPDEAVCRAMVADIGEQVREQPVVRNRVHQAEDEPRYKDVREFVAVPVATENRMLGWLLAINRQTGRDMLDAFWQPIQFEYGTHEASLMATAASIMATQSSNVELIREKEDLLVKMVRSLVSAVEAKDEYTCGHSERVALYGRCLAVHLGYTEEEADRLYLTGLLHDVGKIGVSDATLKKPGRLTDEEFTEIKRHPDEGWAILHELKPLDYVMPGVLQHHERIDGKGYPDGLTDENISLDGRILAVADAYDAMTSDRPYRLGMPTEKAEGILQEGSGTQWDARVIAAFFDVRDKINQIRTEYQPREKPVRKLEDKPQAGCQMSQVYDEDGSVLTWS